MKPNIKIIPSTWLEKDGRRLDCGPYLCGAVEARVQLEKLQAKKEPLQEVTKNGIIGIFNGPRFPRTYVSDPAYGIPFLGSTDMLEADLSHLPLLSEKQVQSNPELLIDDGWSLITCSGTIGRMMFARPGMRGMAGSQHFMRVVPDAAKIRPGFMYAYLHTRFGVHLVVSGTYGAIIQHIEPQHIANLPVPRLGVLEEKCHGLIQESAKLLDQYQQGIVGATKLFFESVGLRDITAAEWHAEGPDLGFCQSLASADSLRGLNFNPRFKKLCARMKEAAWKPLGDICIPGTLKCGNRFKRIDADPEYAYQLIGQKQIFWLNPEGRWIAKSTVGPEVLVEPGTVMVANRGTLGEAELYCRAEFIWGSKAVERAYSQDFLRVVANSQVMLRGCLYAFMRSETAFRMLRSISTGTKLLEYHHTMVQEIPIPFPSMDAQLEIHSVIVEAYEARHRAVALEREAVDLVEKAIMGEA